MFFLLFPPSGLTSLGPPRRIQAHELRRRDWAQLLELGCRAPGLELGQGCLALCGVESPVLVLVANSPSQCPSIY